MESYLDRIKELYKNRMFIIFCAIVILFSVICFRLFFLQIVTGQENLEALTSTIMRTVDIPASRGGIYDRYGRPLAVNEVTFSVMLDDTVETPLSNKEELLISLYEYFNSIGYDMKNVLPINKETPHEFIFNSDDEKKAFFTKLNLNIDDPRFTADYVLNYLFEKHEITEDLDLDLKMFIAYCLTYMSDKNIMITSLIELLISYDETFIDDLPISVNKPYNFLFNDNESRATTFKQSVAMKNSELQYDADETMKYLETFFGIPELFPEEFKRIFISVKYSLYLQRYKKYLPTTIATSIKNETVAIIEEQQDTYPAVSIDTYSLRNYPEGEYFSHILGYIRAISLEELEELAQYGYTQRDIIGKSGIEKVSELELNGENGSMLVEVDSNGRNVNSIIVEEPIAGNNIYLTIDRDLQVATYNYLEDELTTVLISKMTGGSKTDPISAKEFYTSMFEANSISIDSIARATEGEQLNFYNYILDKIENFVPIDETLEFDEAVIANTSSYYLQEYMEDYDSYFDISNNDDRLVARKILIEAIENDEISLTQVIFVLIEQGKISADEAYIERINSGAISPLGVALEKLRNEELLPSDTNLDPCTGSITINDVHTGEVLALVTYPSYDNNRLVNNFDNDYYNNLLINETTPLINRPVSQKKAPGSTFKMVTAMAGLEENLITGTTKIQDLGVFKDAGTPHARCWISTSSGGTHGYLDVKKALEVSCNYFFYELSYRMGASNKDISNYGIDVLNSYMSDFGLDAPTGIEIGESAPNMATPKYKEQITLWQNPDATSSQTRWTEGDTIRASIGQSVNNYSTSNLSKYVSIIANEGTKYKSYLIKSVQNDDGSYINNTLPQVEEVLNYDKDNFDVIKQGMLDVTTGTNGTLRGAFSDLPIGVAAKTGTAQEDLKRPSHTHFVAFAPYDEPQISMSIMIPYGDHTGSPAAVIAKNILIDYLGLDFTPSNSYMQNILEQ